MKTWILIFLFLPYLAYSKEIRTNSVNIPEAPGWLKRVRVDKVADRIQMHLEWTIRRVDVHWYQDPASFEKVHSGGAAVQAFARKSDNTIHLGPKVTDKNFDQVFGHELSHIISYQKYKGAIPSWLEEGMANHISKKGKVDYQWLSKQAWPKDVRKLDHPSTGTVEEAKFHYLASQALVEMLAKKCNLPVLLQLSVQRKMEDYIKTYCEIDDLNLAFRKWVQSKAGSAK